VAPTEGVNVGTCAEQGYETYCSEKSRSAAWICDEDGVETTFSKQKSVCDPSMETKTLRFVDAEYPEVCEETTITDCLLSYERYVRDGWVEGSCAELDINIACPDETHTSEQKCIRSSRGGRSNSLKMMITEVTYVNEKGRYFCDSLSTTEKPAEATPASEQTTTMEPTTATLEPTLATLEPTLATKEPTMATVEPTQEPTEALDCCTGDYLGKLYDTPHFSRDPCQYAWDTRRRTMDI
jgi:hypothetical protein